MTGSAAVSSMRLYLLCDRCGGVWESGKGLPAVCPLCRSRGVQGFALREDRSDAQRARWRRLAGRPTHA